MKLQDRNVFISLGWLQMRTNASARRDGATVQASANRDGTIAQLASEAFFALLHYNDAHLAYYGSVCFTS